MYDILLFLFIINIIVVMLCSPPGMVHEVPLVVTRMMVAVRRAHVQRRRIGVQRGARGPVVRVSSRPRRRCRSALVGLLRPASKNESER